MLASIAFFPTDKGESVSEYVARVVELIDASGLDYRLSAMGTTVEGELEEVYGLIQRCHQELRKDCNRIYAVITIDDRQGRSGRLEGKVGSVEERLQRSLSR